MRCPHDWQPLVPLLPSDDPRYIEHRIGRALAQLDSYQTCTRCGRLRNHAGTYNFPEIEAHIRARAASYNAAYPPLTEA